MTFKVTANKNNKKVELQLGDLKNVTLRGMRQAFYTGGALAKNKINRDVLDGPKTGRVYKYKGRKHRASSVGESFANRSGRARRTRGFNVRGGNELEFGFKKNSETEYTKILEDSKGRPTVEKASNFLQGRMQEIMVTENKKAHKEGFK